jgi:Zn ribbon nucleic-acid-binding protein
MPMCKHPQVRVVAREEDVEFVECQFCGEVFDAAEFVDILNEEDPAADGVEAKGDEA